jgi:hypothetical protein
MNMFVKTPHLRLARTFSSQVVDQWRRFNEAGVVYLEQGELDKAETMFRYF